MNVKEVFETATGSVAGRDHRLAGKNSHDAYYQCITDQVLVAVVCDGCSSGKHSEVGAQIGARLVTEALYENLKKIGLNIEKLGFGDVYPYWERARQDVLAQLRILINAMGGSFSQTVTDYFLFTVVGIMITPNSTFAFSLGDGFITINNEVTPIGLFPDNEPPYLAYGLTGSSVTDLHPELLQFQVHQIIVTEKIESILIGTDGVKDLIAVAGRNIPGRAESVGLLNQFWQEDQFFRNPDMIRRRLVLINRDITKLDPMSPSLIREPGLLPDDTTLIVIRKRR